ncbi:MAG: DUF4381 family protein [Verrucomicrobiota bacterium]
MNPLEEPLRDAAAPVSIPWFEPWMGVVVAALMIAAIIALIPLVRKWQATRQRKLQISAKQSALDAVRQLQGSLATLTGYDFGVRISDIMRTYLTKARGFRATRQTSEEFLREVEAKELLPTASHQRLTAFLRHCDQLKYAPEGRAETPNRDLLEEANLFIREDTA